MNMLIGTDPHARSEACRLVIAVGDDDDATVREILAAADARPDGPPSLQLATAALVVEGAVAAAGPVRWREPVNRSGWAATPDPDPYTGEPGDNQPTDD